MSYKPGRRSKVRVRDIPAEEVQEDFRKTEREAGCYCD
jgi:hypothetical protein